MGQFNRNVRLLLLATMLSGIAEGIFSVDFNLYILTLGIKPDALGTILSAGPYAHALASIPVGFLGELFGYRRAFLGIYGLAGLSRLAQVATSRMDIIIFGAFVAGLAFSGDFVVRLPFLSANTADNQRTHVFSYSSVLSSLSYAVGALLAGYVPNLIFRATQDLATSYRWTLYLSGVLIFVSSLPAFLIRDATPRQRKKISLYPYMWGIDRFTVQVATVEFFIGLTMGLTNPFMNIFYIYRLGTSREFFSNVSALALFPTMLATALGPYIARRLGNLGAVRAARFLIPLSTLAMALTTNRFLGTGAYWAYGALFMMSQSVWFVFVMDTAAPRAKAAASAWLEITFWIGMGLAAQITGALLAKSNYVLPFFAATAAAVVAAVLTHLCMRLCQGPASEAGSIRAAQ
jgi:MFS family permease